MKNVWVESVLIDNDYSYFLRQNYKKHSSPKKLFFLYLLYII